MSTQSLVAHSPLGFAVAFGAGVVSFLSPCVLPLVPSYLSMMSGVSATELAVANRSDQRRLVRTTLLFVAGFTVVFAMYEAGASSVGQLLRRHQELLDQVAGLTIVVMGLAFAGVIRPSFMQRERRLHVLPSKLGEWAAPVMGMAFAIGWTPCIGPALSVVLALASDTHTLARGELMLISYSLGLGVPFLIVGVAFGRLTGVLGFVRAHSRAVNLVSGLVLASLGVLLLTHEVHRLSGWAASLLDRVGLGRLTTS